MDKEKKEQLKKEKTDLLDSEVLKLQKELEYIQARHEQKVKEIQERIEGLSFQKEVFNQHKVK